ncbi:MAG: ribosomal protein S18-alanine N-acetyltransferase [Candidatus Bathyarchaeia archaeon]|nr:ribosomal protein S18-alanine N-acetyltransferase [Candidatus Bathyarchaeota archaeon]
MSNEYRIRECRREDIREVIAINRRCLPENYAPIFFEEIREKYPDLFYVAEVDGKIVGYIMCREETAGFDLPRLKAKRRGHIISIAVLPEYRNRGIGKSLLAKALDSMRERRLEECILEVRVSNSIAINLYRKFGFEIVSQIPFYYLDGEDAYLMKAKLAS